MTKPIVKKWKTILESKKLVKESENGFCIKQYGEASDFEDNTWQCEDFWDKIHEQKLEEALNDYFNELYPEGLDLTHFNDILRFDGDSVLEAIGGVVEKEDEEDLYENTSGTEKVSHFPEWAAYYAMYGEGDDLSDDEIAMIDDYMQKNGYGDLVDVIEGSENEFDRYPVFGKACKTVTAVFSKTSEAKPSQIAEAKANNYSFFLYDVWGNEADGWEVNDQHQVLDHIRINDIDNDMEFLNVLKDNKILNPSISIRDVNFEGTDGDRIEVVDAETEEPLGVFIATNMLQESTQKCRIRLNKKKDDAGDFIVKVYKDNKYDEDASYFTDDWDDACATFKAMAKDMNLKVTKDEARAKAAE